jgi:hypothetical protein
MYLQEDIRTESVGAVARSTTLKLIHGRQSMTFVGANMTRPLQSSMTRYSLLAG